MFGHFTEKAQRVMYYAQEEGVQSIREEIGSKEGEYIRQFRPVLNTQIPKEEDWHKWDTNTVDAAEVIGKYL